MVQLCLRTCLGAPLADPVLILQQLLRAAGVAAGGALVVLLVCGLPWRKPSAGRAAVGWALGVALGFYAGCHALGVRPRWPPREDQDRFLTLLFPAAVAVEMLAAWPRVHRWIGWSMRFAVAALAVPILLHGSVYLNDPPGPQSVRWSPAQAFLAITAMAWSLAGCWILCARLASRVPGRSPAFCLALACLAAGLVVILTGSRSGGQLGIVLAGAIAGAGLASLVLPGALPASALGLGFVGLFAVLVGGRFFSELPTSTAVVVFFSPLLMWVPEVFYARRLPPWLRGLARVVVVAVPLAVVVYQAWQERRAAEQRVAAGRQGE
jgi:hypothetical protein